MRQLAYRIYASLERSPRKTLTLVAVAAFFVFGRVVFELVHSPIFAADKRLLLPGIALSFSWLAIWYASSFVMWLAWFRHVAQAPVQKVVYVLLGTVALWIPIVDVKLGGMQNTFAFLSFSDPTLLKSVASLMYLSPTNHYMFNEFLVMAVGIGAVAWIFSRSVLRSLLTPLAVYVSLIVLQGFVYVCAAPFCVATITSNIPDPVFLCFYFSVLLCAWVCVFLLPELLVYVRSPDSVFSKPYMRRVAVFLAICVVADLFVSRHFFDLLFLVLAEGILVYLLLFLSKHWRDEHLKGLNLFLALYALFLLTAFAGLAFLLAIL